MVSLIFSSCHQQDNIEFKVMAWNIWHGGNDDSLPADGRPSVVNIIRDSDADIILMIETYGSAPYIADSLAYNYHLISSNLCIFSRYPIIETYEYGDNIAPFNFGGAKIMLGDIGEVIFYDTWLHYLPDTRLAPLTEPHDSIIEWENAGSRDDEIRAILRSIDHHITDSQNVPVIIGGDFNSHSHLDWTESTKDFFNHGGVAVDWTISIEMQKKGFTDTYRYINNDPTHYPGTTWMSGANLDGEKAYNRQDRIDYIYSKGRKLNILASEAYQVPDGDTLEFRGNKYMYPSDHGFVLTTFSLKSK